MDREAVDAYTILFGGYLLTVFLLLLSNAPPILFLILLLSVVPFINIVVLGLVALGFVVLEGAEWQIAITLITAVVTTIAVSILLVASRMG